MKQQLFFIILTWHAAIGAVRPNGIFNVARNNNLYRVQQYIDTYGVSILKKKNYLGTPLHNTAWGNALEVAQLIIEIGSCKLLVIKDNLGDTPLHLAVQKNLPEITKLIIEKGGPELLEMKNNGGLTPLHQAIENHAIDIIQLLIQNGANVNTQKRYDGSTPLHCILYNPPKPWATPPNGALQPHKAKRAIQLLFKNGAKIHIKNKKGETSCDLTASEETDMEIRELFKEHHNSLDRQLLEGIANNDISTVKSILKLGVKINSRVKGKENNGWTPLHISVRHNHPEMVAFLLGYGADPTIYDTNGDTPVDIAAGADKEVLQTFITAAYTYKKKKTRCTIM